MSDKLKKTEKEQKLPNMPVYAPSVDVYETEKEIVITSDMPGVSKENLNIELDGDTLSIEGKNSHRPDEKLNALYRSWRSGNYRRSFTLPSGLDKEKISAQIADGVLTLTIPKEEKAAPRKIEVKAQ